MNKSNIYSVATSIFAIFFWLIRVNRLHNAERDELIHWVGSIDLIGYRQEPNFLRIHSLFNKNEEKELNEIEAKLEKNTKQCLMNSKSTVMK